MNIGYGVFGDDKWWWSTQSNFTNVIDIIAYNPSKYFDHFLNNLIVSIIELIKGMGILAPIAVIAIPSSFYYLKSQHKITLIVIFSLFLLGICQAFVTPESFLAWVFILTIVSVFILNEATKNLTKSNYKTIFLILIFLMGSIYCSINVSGYLNGQSSDGGQLDESEQIAKFLIGYDSEISINI